MRGALGMVIHGKGPALIVPPPELNSVTKENSPDTWQLIEVDRILSAKKVSRRLPFLGLFCESRIREDLDGLGIK